MLIKLILYGSLFLFAADPPAENPVTQEEGPALIELLPGLSVADGVVEFSAKIAVDAHHPETPDVYLEMFITAPDSREHESLLVSRIRPSNLHAALLAAGFTPGTPMSRTAEGQPQPASGDRVDILVLSNHDNDDREQWVPLTDWVVHIDTGQQLVQNESWNGIVFAGSKFSSHGYVADQSGTIASLTPFGDEVLSPTWSLSPSAEVDEPVWIVNCEKYPSKNDEVIVRVVRQKNPASDSEEESEKPDRIDIDRDP